jgi:hypothetical protein
MRAKARQAALIAAAEPMVRSFFAAFSFVEKLRTRVSMDERIVSDPGAAFRRDRMVRDQIARRGVREPQVLEAMRRVRREAFLPRSMAEFAYDDAPLPIDEDQTISQPYIVALMIEALDLKPSDKVLEIGTGSGYAAAVLRWQAKCTR